MTSPPTTPQPPHTYNLPGVSHHPDYDITSVSPSHFQRTPHGDRLAPLSQLNSFRGRALAYTTTLSPSPSPPSNLHLGAFDFEKEDTLEAVKTPRMYTVSHDTSSDFPTLETRPVSVASHATSHSYTHSHSRIPRSMSTSTSKPLAPPPPRISVPPMVKCATCVLVPGFLVREFKRVFDACRVCGQLTGEGVQELVIRGGSEGEVSREMEGWVGEVVGLRKGRGRGF